MDLCSSCNQRLECDNPGHMCYDCYQGYVDYCNEEDGCYVKDYPSSVHKTTPTSEHWKREHEKYLKECDRRDFVEDMYAGNCFRCGKHSGNCQCDDDETVARDLDEVHNSLDVKSPDPTAQLEEDLAKLAAQPEIDGDLKITIDGYRIVINDCTIGEGETRVEFTNQGAYKSGLREIPASTVKRFEKVCKRLIDYLTIMESIYGDDFSTPCEDSDNPMYDDQHKYSGLLQGVRNTMRSILDYNNDIALEVVLWCEDLLNTTTVTD